MSYHDYEDIDTIRPLDQFERWDWLDARDMVLVTKSGKAINLPAKRLNWDFICGVLVMVGISVGAWYGLVYGVKAIVAAVQR